MTFMYVKDNTPDISRLSITIGDDCKIKSVPSRSSSRIDSHVVYRVIFSFIAFLFIYSDPNFIGYMAIPIFTFAFLCSIFWFCHYYFGRILVTLTRKFICIDYENIIKYRKYKIGYNEINKLYWTRESYNLWQVFFNFNPFVTPFFFNYMRSGVVIEQRGRKRALARGVDEAEGEFIVGLIEEARRLGDKP